MTGTLKTADPKVAAKGVTLARAQLIQQVDETARSADVNARLAELPPDQRALYDRAGGLEGLLEAFQRTQKAQAFLAAGDPSTMADTDELPPDPLGSRSGSRRAPGGVSRARGVSPGAKAKTLRALGKKVDIPGGDLTGLAELAESFVRAKSYTVQNADSLRYTVGAGPNSMATSPLPN